MKKFARIVLGTAVAVSAASFGMAVASGTSAVEKEKVVAVMQKSAIDAAQATVEKVESNEPEWNDTPQTGTSERETCIDTFALQSGSHGINVDADVLKNGGNISDAIVSIDWLKLISTFDANFEGNKNAYSKFKQGFEEHYQEIYDALAKLMSKISDWFNAQ